MQSIDTLVNEAALLFGSWSWVWVMESESPYVHEASLEEPL